MARRKVGNSHTTISVRWEDKEKLRRHAKLVKKTKNGDMSVSYTHLTLPTNREV